jgi:HEAT repeat protein
VRAAAADAIASWGEKAPLEPVLLLARDADPSVRAAAARALGLAGRGSPQVVAPVLRAALADVDAEVRRMAASALAWCRDEASSSALRARLSDPVAVVRAAALRALARLSSGNHEAAVVSLLRDADPFVRAEAIRFLRARGSESCLAALAELEDDGALIGGATVGELARDARQQVAQRQRSWLGRLFRRGRR